MKCPNCSSENISTTVKGFNFQNSFIGGILLGWIGTLFGGFEIGHKVYRCENCGFAEEYDDEGRFKAPIFHQIVRGLGRAVAAMIALPAALIIFILCINCADKILSLLGVIK